jgi:hypothetical protein
VALDDMKVGFRGTGRISWKSWRTVLLTGFVAYLAATDGRAQRYRNQFVPYSSVGFGIGTSNYYGDMASYRRIVPSTFKMMRWSVSGEYTRHFSPRLAARASLTWARIAGDDYQMNRSGRNVHQGFFVRNLHFRNDIKELAAVGIFKLTPDNRTHDRRPEFGAYFFGGVALFAHNPKARLPVVSGETDKQRWVALQPLGTEGQGREGYDKLYSKVGFAIPLGFGLRYKINPRFDVAAELGFRFTTTDYLDDVSKGYPDPSVFAAGADPVQAQQLSYRALEQNPARFPKKERTEILRNYLGLTEAEDPYAYVQGGNFPLMRGNNFNQMDAYMTGTIKLVYVLTPSIKCPPLK